MTARNSTLGVLVMIAEKDFTKILFPREPWCSRYYFYLIFVMLCLFVVLLLLLLVVLLTLVVVAN